MIKFIVFIGFSFTFAAFSQEYETVVEDTVFNSSSKVILDEKTIQESKAPDLISLITTQANITLFNNNFQPPQLFMRGGESSHVLFIVDGVPVYDVAWAQRTINLNSLDIKNVKRIEILKGGQTVLQGGQALAGVVKIETFGDQFKDQTQLSATAGLPHDPFDKGLLDDRRLGVSWEKSPSENSALKVSGRLMERKNQSPVLHSNQMYDQRNQNLDMGFEARGPVHLQLRQFWFKDKSWNPTTVNNAGQQSLADSDVQRQDEQIGLSASAQFQTLSLKPRLALYGQKGWRFFFSDPSSANVNAKFRSGLQGALFDLTAFESELIKLKAGLSYLKEEFFLDDSIATLSPVPRAADTFTETRGVYTFLQWNLSSSVLFETGARQEKVSHLTGKNSYQVGLTFFKDTKLEWVTGYRAPSAAQKYGVFENPGLKPEVSQTYSLTQDIHLTERGELSFTLFETSFSNFIETKSIGMGVLQYQNTAKVKTRGVESTASYAMTPQQTVQLSYAYQEPWDQVRHERLRRRPLVSGSVRVLHTGEQWGGMIEAAGVGTRYDFFGPNRYVFPGYALLNTSLRYKQDDTNTFSLRVSNWLNTRPEISIDYYAEGRTALLTWEHVF